MMRGVRERVVSIGKAICPHLLMAVEKGGEEKCIAISFDEIHYLVQVAFR